MRDYTDEELKAFQKEIAFDEKFNPERTEKPAFQEHKKLIEGLMDDRGLVKVTYKNDMDKAAENTTADKVEVAEKVDEMIDKNSIIEFDYTLEAIQQIVATVNEIDKTDLDAVEEKRKELVRVRTTITKKGKSYRDDANAFNKKVLTKEKTYLAVCTPVEDELKKILDDAKLKKIMEIRKALLPERMKLAKEIVDEMGIYLDTNLEETILDLDDSGFVKFIEDLKQEREVFDLEKKAQKEREDKIREDAIAETKATAEVEKEAAVEKAVEETKNEVAEKPEVESPYQPDEARINVTEERFVVVLRSAGISDDIIDKVWDELKN